VGDAWSRREQQNVALFHYADYRADLPAEMCRLATAVGIELGPDRAHELAAEATITRMRDRAAEVVPNASNGQWRSTEAFLRSGKSGEGRSLLTDTDLERYEARLADLLDPDVAAWLRQGRLGSGVDPLIHPMG
jgi:hypothetical protein